MNPFLKLENQEVLVNIKGNSTDMEELDIDRFYTLLLQDISKVLSSHPMHVEAEAKIGLCPRWQCKLANRRDLHITSPQGLLGTIRIDHHEKSYKFADRHSMDHWFRLSFHPETSNFITSHEFYTLYHMLQ